MPLFDEVVLLTSGLDNVISFDAVRPHAARQLKSDARGEWTMQSIEQLLSCCKDCTSLVLQNAVTHMVHKAE